jgi:hypothetical protein
MSGKRKFVVFLVLVVALMLSNLASAADLTPNVYP